MSGILLVNFLYSGNISEEAKSKFANSSQLGLLSLNTILNRKGISSDIMDLNIEMIKERIKLDKEYYDVISSKICDSKPEYVGFTAMANNFVNVIILSEAVKQKLPEVKLFFGGPQATAVGEYILREYKHIDFVCLGESEITIEKFSDYLLSKLSFDEIPGLMYRLEDNSIVSNQCAQLIPSEELTTINYDSIIKKYEMNISDTAFRIEGGRGCPYNCVFCSTSTFWNRKFRIKSMEALKSEIQNLKQKYHVSKVSIVHDLFTCDRIKLHDFCTLAKNENIVWACSSRVDVLNENDLKIMKECGCEEIFFGIETGSQKMQKKVGKNLDLSKADEIIKYASQLGINPVVSFVIGFPFESIDEIEESLQRALLYASFGSDRVLINILTPEHGSQIMNDYEKSLMFEDDFYISSFDSVIIDLAKELDMIRNHAYIFNHYYSIDNPEFNFYFLCFVRDMFNMLCKEFKHTLIRLINERNISLIDLFFDLANIENKTMLVKEDLILAHDVKSILRNLNHYIDNLKLSTIKETYIIELLKLHVR